MSADLSPQPTSERDVEINKLQNWAIKLKSLVDESVDCASEMTFTTSFYLDLHTNLENLLDRVNDELNIIKQ